MNARQGTARDLAARWAPRAKRLVAERLEAGERVTSTMLRDLIGQQVAQQEGVTWQPSEGWAKAILRGLREENRSGSAAEG